MRSLYFLSLVFLLTHASFSFALEPVIFGPEFTFMRDTSTVEKNYLEMLKLHLIQNQPPGAAFTLGTLYENRITFISPNGWWFVYSTDSGGYEMGTKPMSFADFKRYGRDIQDAIFVTAANSGYFPALWQGGGHINIDNDIFRKNPLLLYNFVIDLLNHNELFLGIFNFDMQNQRSHSFSGDHNTYFTPRSLEQIVNQLEADVPNSGFTYEGVLFGLQQNVGRVGWSFSFRNIDERRFEIRGFRPQASMDVFLRQIELLEHRLQLLERNTTKLRYAPRVPMQVLKDDLTPPVDPQLALRAFYEYVTESGLLWKDHRDYLWPQWTTGGELAKFETSDWFIHKEGARCVRLLTPQH
jgi:hypothetical protein